MASRIHINERYMDMEECWESIWMRKSREGVRDASLSMIEIHLADRRVVLSGMSVLGHWDACGFCMLFACYIFSGGFCMLFACYIFSEGLCCDDHVPVIKGLIVPPTFTTPRTKYSVHVTSAILDCCSWRLVMSGAYLVYAWRNPHHNIGQGAVPLHEDREFGVDVPRWVVLTEEEYISFECNVRSMQLS